MNGPAGTKTCTIPSTVEVIIEPTPKVGNGVSVGVGVAVGLGVDVRDGWRVGVADGGRVGGTVAVGVLVRVGVVVSTAATSAAGVPKGVVVVPDGGPGSSASINHTNKVIPATPTGDQRAAFGKARQRRPTACHPS